MRAGEQIYLGDGVYLEFSGFDFVLYTSDGFTRTNVVHLDEEVAGNLVKQLQKAWGEQ